MLALNMLFIFGAAEISAQQIIPKRSHALAEPELSLEPLDATGTLDVIAIMVEFQPDSNRLTSGTGIFGEGGLPYLENNPPAIDPLPHDQAYFEAHLEFAKNYYEKSSDGQLTLNYRVLPEVYRLSGKMEEYSPVGETFTNEKLAVLAEEAWQLVEENGGFDATGLDPDRTAFVIFHAGVGRDIELIGTNLDITPYDIPSIYLSKNNLRTLLNDPAFDGFEINNGTFRITNTLILPRTESRRGLDIQDDEFVFPLSINGLVVASIGSHLGLPDLFNTETGDPAIGRFGLMDGAGFFAYSGLLPPEPSAWEKIYLGWETPFNISTEDGEITLPASSLDQPQSIAKYELSSSEYFLIENRHRDPDQSGITITIRKADGTEVQQTFTNANDGFINQTADFDTLFDEAGVLVNADNFDFSLPGGLDIGPDEVEGTDDDRHLNGGILIWHIDEAVIQSRLTSGGINSDRLRRGVDLEEADGAQDIGPGIPGALDNSAAFGSPFDFWWEGNNYRVISETGGETQLYENRFGADTYPNNNSNSGSPSFFELYDFSDNQPIASFNIRSIQPYEDIYTSRFSVQLDSTQNYFTASDNYYNYYPLSLSVFETDTDTFLIIPSQETVTAVNISNPENQQITISEASVQQPFIGSDYLVLADKPSPSSETINVTALSWSSTATQFDTLWASVLPRNKGFISSQDGDTLFADLTDQALLASDGSVLTTGTLPFQQSEKINGNYSTSLDNAVTFTADPKPQDYLPNNSADRLYSGIIQLENRPLFFVMEDDKFTIFDPQESEPITLIDEENAEWPAILDDASILWIDKSRNEIVGKNRQGGFLNHTPISAPDNVQFIGTPLYTNLLSDEDKYAILVIGKDQQSLNIYAFDTEGNALQGFPLYIGKAAEENAQPIHPIIYNGTFYAVGYEGTLKAWNLTQVNDTKWGSRYGNTPFNKISARVENTQSDGSITYGILNEAETYNWPNPARESTNIRFEVARPGGVVDISVMNLSGRIIFKETVQTTGGFPQEVHVNTQSWGSGGYIALVKATVQGKTETKLIKIGVIH